MRMRKILALLTLAAVCASGAIRPALATLSGTASPNARIRLREGGAEIAGGGASARDGVVTIHDGGTYEITGEAENLQIVVSAGKRAEITLLLNGASLVNPDGPAICIQKAGSAAIVLAEGTRNRLISGAATDDPIPDPDASGGALLSKCDLTVTGEGSLFIGGYINNGIHASDSLTVEAGRLTVEAANHGVKGKDALTVCGGALDVSAGADGLHSEGAIILSGGSITVSAADDGVHADQTLDISGGTVDITDSYEGLEAVEICISGGDLRVSAKDDGVNANGGASVLGRNKAAAKEETAGEMPLLRVTGGSLYVSALGDGLDSNGDLLIEGGTVVVDGPDNGGNGALDSGMENGGACRVSGGTVLAVGAAGMAESFDETSKQCAFCWELTFAAGDEIVLTDVSGGELFRHTALRSGSSIVFSSPELLQGETYLLTAGENSAEIEMTSANVTNSKNFFSNPRGFGMPGGVDGRDPDMPKEDRRRGFRHAPGEDGTRPEPPPNGETESDSPFPGPLENPQPELPPEDAGNAPKP